MRLRGWLPPIAALLVWMGFAGGEQGGGAGEPKSFSRGAHLRHRKRRCGGKDHASLTRPCMSNDTLCGEWHGETFEPFNCHYEQLTGAQARKCLGNRTLAFIGDSMIRDIFMGVVNFLSDTELDSKTANTKFDHERLNLGNNVTQRIRDFKMWKNNVPAHNYNGHIYPIPAKAAALGYEFQIQMWSLYRNEFVDHQVDDVLSNYKLMVENTDLHHIDVAFWNHGLHDWGWWEKPPMGEKYYSVIVQRWIESRKIADMPVVWVSMNPECREKITFPFGDMNRQVAMVDDGNSYANARLLADRLPYWDAGAVLRTASRCEYSSDGVHVKMFVDKMRARMLFNHLCDHNARWRGGDDVFM